MSPNRLPQQRHRELEWQAAVGRAQGRPPPQIAADLAAQATITRLWAWRLATGWTRAELLGRLRQAGAARVDESMLWRWEVGERAPSRKHLDRLCRVYQTRPDLLGYGHDYTAGLAAALAAHHRGCPKRQHPRPLRPEDEVCPGCGCEAALYLCASGWRCGDCLAEALIDDPGIPAMAAMAATTRPVQPTRPRRPSRRRQRHAPRHTTALGATTPRGTSDAEQAVVA